MDTTLLGLLMMLVILLLGALIAVLYMQLRKLQDDSGDSAEALQYLAQTIQQSQMQAAALGEKLSQIEPVINAASRAEIELRGLTERVATLEQSQTMANQGILYLSKSLIQTDSSIKSEYNKGQQQLLNTLYQIGSRLAADISQFQQSAGVELAELQAMAAGLSEAIRRLEAMLAGAQSKGLAGENILEDDLRAHVSKLGGGLTGLQISTAVPATTSALPMLADMPSDAQEDDFAMALEAWQLDGAVTRS